MTQRVLVCLLAMTTLAFVSRGADPGPVTLKVGDAAPKLYVSKWVKGDPVDEFKAGHVYVIDFWATWCGPCKRSMPHVTDLQKKYAEKVTIIGLNIWETNLEAVEPFVIEMGDQLAYSIAIDEVPQGQRQGKSAAAWMRAAGQRGIPTVFVVDQQGKIAWIGHPMTMDRPLAQIVQGTFDAQKEAEFSKAMDELETGQREAMKNKDWDKVIEYADKIIEKDATAAPNQGIMKLRALYGKSDWEAGNSLAAKLLEQHASDSDALRALAWTMVRAGGEADVKLALAAAVKAQQVRDDGWAGKHLLAQAHFANKEYAKAVELQTEVVQATQDQMKQYHQRLLDTYKKAAEGQ